MKALSSDDRPVSLILRSEALDAHSLYPQWVMFFNKGCWRRGTGTAILSVIPQTCLEPMLCQALDEALCTKRLQRPPRSMQSAQEAAWEPGESWYEKLWEPRKEAARLV